MTAPDFEKMARDFIPAHQADSDEDAASALSALLRSVHASRDAEVKAAREQGIREAAEEVALAQHEVVPREAAKLGESKRARRAYESAFALCSRRILALLNAPKGG